MQELIRVYVISTGRPENVAKMRELITGFDPIFVIKPKDVRTYAMYGGKDFKYLTAEGLCSARNAALNDAFANGSFCVQVSDDLRKLEYVDAQGDKATPISFHQAVAGMFEGMNETGAMLAGVAPTANAFYFNKPFDTKAFIVGDFIMVKPCDLRFDETMVLKEDYDYTIQHFLRYGKVHRDNRMLCTFLHKTNRGGAVDMRTMDRERAMIAHLRAKWGDGVFRDNPRRAGEILIDFGKVRIR